VTPPKSTVTEFSRSKAAGGVSLGPDGGNVDGGICSVEVGGEADGGEAAELGGGWLDGMQVKRYFLEIKYLKMPILVASNLSVA
jgi:hypothetical protein